MAGARACTRGGGEMWHSRRRQIIIISNSSSSGGGSSRNRRTARLGKRTCKAFYFRFGERIRQTRRADKDDNGRRGEGLRGAQRGQRQGGQTTPAGDRMGTETPVATWTICEHVRLVVVFTETIKTCTQSCFFVLLNRFVGRECAASLCATITLVLVLLVRRRRPRNLTPQLAPPQLSLAQI